MSMCWLFMKVKLNQLYRFSDPFDFPMVLTQQQAEPFRRMIRPLQRPAPSYPYPARQKRTAYEAAETQMRLRVPKPPPAPEVQYTSGGMADIAEATDFYDPFYFSRRFKAAYGLAPLFY